MSDTREEAIRARAITLWEADGCPSGRDLDYWLAAESALAKEEAVEVAAPAAAAPRRKSPAKPRATKAKAKA